MAALDRRTGPRSEPTDGRTTAGPGEDVYLTSATTLASPSCRCCVVQPLKIRRNIQSGWLHVDLYCIHLIPSSHDAFWEFRAQLPACLVSFNRTSSVESSRTWILFPTEVGLQFVLGGMNTDTFKEKTEIWSTILVGTELRFRLSDYLPVLADSWEQLIKR